MAENTKICLIGAGNMGGAMLSGWIEGGVKPSSVLVVDPSPRPDIVTRLKDLGVETVQAIPNNYQADVLIIAVKPQIMGQVLPGIAKAIGPKTVSVSVAAGTKVDFLEQHLGKTSIIRVMPNTPAILRRGISVGFANQFVTDAQRAMVTLLMEAIGKVAWVEDEKHIDAVTAVSGSGPAYVFHLAECMAAAGVAEGLSPELANLLARETIAGAGEMLSKLEEPASKLRENVTSPNGTTAAALDVLMGKSDMGKLVAKAIKAARIRSEELS